MYNLLLCNLFLQLFCLYFAFRESCIGSCRWCCQVILSPNRYQRDNSTLEKRETGWKQMSHFWKPFSSPSVSHILWNQASHYPGETFHEMELNMSLITSTGCLDNHIQKLMWNLKKLPVTRWQPVSMLNQSLGHWRALQKHHLFCCCSAHSYLFTFQANGVEPTQHIRE